MTTISVYQTPDHLPGERAHNLVTADGAQIAWGARPDDRRGASLIFDGLAATGVDWRVNPPTRVDIDLDGRHLAARLRARGTRTIIITNAHYLVPTVRTVAISLAEAVGADLTFSYEDGHGTTLHQTGLLDDAERNDWPCYPEDEPPFTIPDPADNPPATATGPTSETDFPPIIATVGFALFRAWNRHLLTPGQFRQVDDLYCATYYDVRNQDTDASTVSRLANQHLAQPTRPQAITALRAMQAALFRNGVTWRLPLATLDAWLESTGSRPPTDHDYRRLQQLDDPQKPVVAILISLGYQANELHQVRLTADGYLTTPEKPPTAVPAAALLPLQVAADIYDGKLLTCSRPRTQIIIKELTQQFGFPLPQRRVMDHSRQSLLAPDNLTLVHYRKDDQ